MSQLDQTQMPVCIFQNKQCKHLETSDKHQTTKNKDNNKNAYVFSFSQTFGVEI